jgi:hypothetical protein
MLSQSGLNPVEVISAQIQNRIAQFLALKSTLIGLISHPTVSISSKAKELYTTQTVLEKQLTANLQKIDQMKQGAWNFSDVSILGLFYADMEEQIKDVEELARTAGKTVQADTFPRPEEALKYLPWLVVGGLGLAFFAAWRRR